MKPIMETERLILREMELSDLSALCAILRDEQTMYAYEGAFSQDEAQAWLFSVKNAQGRTADEDA